jgi:hypothetical protein
MVRRSLAVSLVTLLAATASLEGGTACTGHYNTTSGGGSGSSGSSSGSGSGSGGSSGSSGSGSGGSSGSSGSGSGGSTTLCGTGATGAYCCLGSAQGCTNSITDTACVPMGGAALDHCPTSGLLGCCTTSMTVQCSYPGNSGNESASALESSCLAGGGSWSALPP